MEESEFNSSAPASAEPGHDLPPVIASYSVPPPLPPRAPAHPRVRGEVWLFLAGSLAVTLLAFFTQGELGAFFVCSWEAMPLAFMCVLAYVGVERVWARVLARICLGTLLGLALGMVVLFSYFSLVGRYTANPADLFLPMEEGGGRRLLGVVALGFLAVGSSLLAWTPSIKAAYQSGEPGESTPGLTTLALGTVMPITLLCLVPLLIIGEPPILLWIEKLAAVGRTLDEDRSPGGMLRDQVYGLCWIIPAAVFAVGYGTRRTLPQVLERLGLVRPARRHVLRAALLTAGLLGAGYLWDHGIHWLWLRLGWPVTDETAISALFEFALTPVGAVVIGVTAGLGEELAVRGVLQPRLGILLSNLFFTAAHAFQYHWDGLLSVFLTGLVLGLIRRRSNTTTSAIVHGAYDFVLVFYEAMHRTAGG